MTLQGRYQIVRKLGDGGMGAVYEGLHTVIKRRVAIKVLHPQFAKNPEIVARFHREAEAATSIGHPNIVEVTDMGTFDDGSAYMVLEFLDGRDWSHDIENDGPQSLGKTAQILTQVCDALQAAHGKGIVHRDLKPENIFLIERSGNPNFVKVVDFGISKIVDAGPESAGHSLTQTGTALGTPYYMAPEQCQGKKDIDHRADIYSLGVILFQALTAQYPFDDESYPMLVLKICTEQPPLLSTFRPDLPPQLQGILHAMLAKNRDNRFANVSELKAALAPYVGETAAPVLAENAPSTAARGPSVLHGPSAGTPSSSPTGTAYLPNNSGTGPGMTPYPLQAQGGGNRGLILAVAAMLGLIVAGGIGVGAWAATSSDDPTVAETPDTGTPPAADPAPAPVVEAPVESPPEPVAAAEDVPAEPAAPTAVQAPAAEMLSITLSAPPGATMTLDGRLIPNPFTGDVPAGEHRLQASRRGYVDYDEPLQVSFATTFPRIRMERVGGRPTVRPATPVGGSTTGGPMFGGGVRRPTPSPPPPPRRRTGETVSDSVIF